VSQLSVVMVLLESPSVVLNVEVFVTITAGTVEHEAVIDSTTVAL
jgi:hypothetical protein